MRRLALLLLLAPLVAACGGGSSKPKPDVAFPGATHRTVAKGTASFTLSITAAVAGQNVRSSERGRISFTETRAHFYKLVPGGGLPQEEVLDGPFAYTNANVDAAMNDPTVKPWTKLDTRRLSAADRARRPDELAHVRVVAYLANGVTNAKRIDGSHFRGVVDPQRVVASAPNADRKAFRIAIDNDYLAKPFPADFWLDSAGRVRRVRVDYRTARGGRVLVDASLSRFGEPVDLAVPPAKDVEDITP